MSTSLPTPAASRPASAAGGGNPKPIAWMPTNLHPVSEKLAAEYFDVITPSDPRAPIWYELADVGIIRTGKVLEEEVRKASPKLKIFTRNGVGYDMIPIAACKERGIRVTNQPGSNAKAVGELCLGLALSVSRRIVELDRRLRRGEFLPNIHYLAPSLDGKTLGLVGMGNISRDVARRFHGALDSPILVYSPTSNPLNWTDKCPSGLPAIPHIRVNSLEEILQQSDVVSLHCPLFDHNRGMMSTDQFKMMKRSAILLNTARGGLIDEPALLHALKTKEIGGAGLDVVVHEPATPEVYRELYELENVVILPHAGGGTDEVQIESCNIAVMTAWSFIQGEGVGPSNIIC